MPGKKIRKDIFLNTITCKMPGNMIEDFGFLYDFSSEIPGTIFSKFRDEIIRGILIETIKIGNLKTGIS